MANPDGVLTDADVRAADALLDALAAVVAEHTVRLDGDETAADVRACLFGLHHRGVLAQGLADVRSAGYLEGLQAGRREVGQMVQELLRDEGLAP